jgi:hypothetical protein
VSAQVFTRQGARELDRAAAAQAAATAQMEQARADEARALAELRVMQAQQEAAERTQERRQERRQAAAAARRKRRSELVAAVRAGVAERRALVAVLPMMALSAGTAIPAQFLSYKGLLGGDWSAGVSAGVIAAMVEGGTWLGAALESAAHAKQRSAMPARVLTWVLAGVAAAVNVQHGLHPGGGRQGRWDVATVFAAASLMGPLCWAMYAHLQTGSDRPHVRGTRRLRVLRRARYPRLVWRALSLRAATVPPMTVDEAWTRVWAEHQSRLRAGRKSLDPDQVQDSTGARVEVDPTPDTVGSSPVEPVEDVAAEGVTDAAVGERVGDSTGVRKDSTGGRVEVDPVVGSSRVEPVEVPVAPVLWLAPDPVVDEAEEAEIRAQLVQALRAGVLTPDSSVEAMRLHLGVAWRRARPWKDRLADLALEAQAAGVGEPGADDDLDLDDVDLDEFEEQDTDEADLDGFDQEEFDLGEVDQDRAGAGRVLAVAGVG